MFLYTDKGILLIPEDIEQEILLSRAEANTSIAVPSEINSGEFDEFVVTDKIVCYKIKRVKKPTAIDSEKSKVIQPSKKRGWKNFLSYIRDYWSDIGD